MDTYYITTAIPYVNARPHIGFAYELIATDVLARWKRLEGKDVFFVTGTDENAQKNVKAAQKAGKEVKVFVDEMSRNFVELCKQFTISNDHFIRTSEKKHFKVAQDLFEQAHKKGDIYKGMYKGLYCEGCEAFYVEKDLVKGKCPEHKKPLKEIEEENYFFKMSKYQKQLIAHIKKNNFIMPVTRKNEILSRLEEPLKDLSVSRYNIEWGIPVPFDKKSTLYVWYDALINYLSALDYPGKRYKKYWPADVHVIGTGVNWFHTVIWPAMLLSAGIELPKQVFVHGYVNIKGEKMSKSLGNVIDPLRLAKAYDSDAIRYYLIREIPFGEDGDFSEETLKQRINGELVSDLGNLANRVLTLASKFEGAFTGKDELSKHIHLEKIQKHIDKYELHHALDEVFSFVRACNKYINDKEVWNQEDKEKSQSLYNLLEALRVISILITPFLPKTAEHLAEQLGVKGGTLKECTFKDYNGAVKKGGLLFKKVE